jgi:hypothetical protein
MRLYAFNLMYMNGIHNGIQAGHASSKLEDRYPENSPEGRAYRDWRRNHQTIIITNAGYVKVLYEIYDLLEKLAQDWVPIDGVEGLAFAKFHESEEAASGLLTSIVVTVPPSCYVEFKDKAARERRNLLFKRIKDLDLTSYEAALLDDGTFTVHERLELLCASFSLAT